MGQDQGEAGAQQLASDPDVRAQQLRAEIEGTRQDLGDTAAELAGKTDVKARARDKFEQVKRSTAVRKERVLSKTGSSDESGSGGGSGAAVAQLKRRAQEHPVPTAAAGALVGGFLLGRLTSRRDD